MAYSAKAVANEFLKLAKQDGKQLSPMQLQKLVFFAYGWYLVITGKRLINERIEAWTWGPVIPSLYSEFRRFGSGSITDFARDHSWSGLTVSLQPYRLDSGDPEQDGEAIRIIKRVWDIYGKYSASQLSAMTHEPNSPWSLTPDKDVKGTDISDEMIADYFRQLAANHEQRAYAK